MKKIIIAAGILILAGCGQKSVPVQTQPLLPVPAPITQPPTDMPASQPPVNDVVTNQPDQSLIYKNTNYGFQITFPKGWENFKVDIDATQVKTTKAVYIHFLIPTADQTYPAITLKNGQQLKGYADVVAITAWDKNEWDKEINSNECKQNPTPDCPFAGSKLGANAKYVFDISQGNGMLPDDVNNPVANIFKKNGSETVGQAAARNLNFQLLP